jgi:hypothetical protein
MIFDVHEVKIGLAVVLQNCTIMIFDPQTCKQIALLNTNARNQLYEYSEF